MQQRIRTLIAALLILACVSLPTDVQGKSTKLITSWKNPKFGGGHFKKVLVVGMTADPGRRADFEDDLAESLTQAHVEVIPGNTILLRPEGAAVNIDYIHLQIREHKIDGVIVARLVSIKDSVTYIPPDVVAPYPFYSSFYRYYGTISPVVYSPGYLREEKTVRIETNVYAMTTDDTELVWTGTSDTFNPKDAHKVIKGVVKLITEELTKDRVL